jgi:hypothetical protein
MIRRPHLLILVASLAVPLCARGEPLPIDESAAAARRQGTTAARMMTPGDSGRRANEMSVFRPLELGELFAGEGDFDWPVSTRLAPGALSAGVQRPLPVEARPSGPERDSLTSIWQPHRARASQAVYELDESSSANSLGGPVRLLSATDEEILPPIPQNFEWLNDDGNPIAVPTDDGMTPVGDAAIPAEGAPPLIVGSGDEPGGIVLPGGVQLHERTRFATRFGWWFVDDQGSPVKIGEYQSLESSPFFDIDGLRTDGLRTLDFSGSILDNDAQAARVRFFGPSHTARLDYQGYLRHLDHDPFDFFVDFNRQPPLPLPGPPANYRDMKEDLTVGDDFAIRVQQLNTSFTGKLTPNIDWRLNVWGMRKHGERQASALAHCFVAPNATDTNGNPVTGAACHMLSQSQRIDWLTAEIEPVVAGHFGPVTVEYSRTMRTLTTDDQLVTRPYDNFGFSGELPYAIVPENFTEIDRLKVGVTLPDCRDGYARLFAGHTENQFRDTDRKFRGFDLRLTDRSFDGVSLTGYAKNYVQTGELPGFLLPNETAAAITRPINYDRTIAGLAASWLPFYHEHTLRSRLRFSSGYEYRELDRGNAIFVENALTSVQSSTTTNLFRVRGSLGWTPTWTTYTQYQLSFIDDPLYGVPIENTTTNTSLPTQIHAVQFGNTWSPSNVFFLHGLIGVNNNWNSSDIANFDASIYDFIITAWYAPTPRWTVSGGLGFLSNWIDQDITLGSKSNPLTLPWDYGGQSDVVNLGTTYAWTKRLTMSGGIDFVRGRNAVGSLAPWPDLPTYFDVNVETIRFSAGADYELGTNSSLYVRYQLFDYDDKSDLLDSGTSEMLLFGANAFF